MARPLDPAVGAPPVTLSDEDRLALVTKIKLLKKQNAQLAEALCSLPRNRVFSEDLLLEIEGVHRQATSIAESIGLEL
jgi:hypothetical protein